MSTRKIKTDDSTWRKFRRDWGNTIFTSDDKIIRKIDTRGLGIYAIESLISWAISIEERPPLVLEVGDNISDEVTSSILIHPKLRILIENKFSSVTKSQNFLYSDNLWPLPWLILQTSNGVVVPL